MMNLHFTLYNFNEDSEAFTKNFSCYNCKNLKQCQKLRNVSPQTCNIIHELKQEIGKPNDIKSVRTTEILYYYSTTGRFNESVEKMRRVINSYNQATK